MEHQLERREVAPARPPFAPDREPPGNARASAGLTSANAATNAAPVKIPTAASAASSAPGAATNAAPVKTPTAAASAASSAPGAATNAAPAKTPTAASAATNAGPAKTPTAAATGPATIPSIAESNARKGTTSSPKPATATVPLASPATPEVRLVNRTLSTADAVDDRDARLFDPEGSAEGCASGDCLPEKAPAANDADRWKAAVEAVRLASPRHGKSLSHGRLVGLEPGTVRIAFPQDAAFHRSTVFGMSRQLIEQELTKYFGAPTRVAEDNTTVALKAAAPSIAEEEAKETAARHRDIDARISQHPAIRNVVRLLGGTVEHVQYLEPAREAPSLVRPPAAPDDE